MKRRKPKTVTNFSKVKHRHGNPVASFECALVNKSIIYVTMHKQTAPINMLFRSKAPKNTTNCCYGHAAKTGGLFFIVPHGRRL